MIGFFIRNGEVDGDPIFFKLHLQVLLLFHDMRNLNANLRGGLIPRVDELGAQQLGLIDVLPSQFHHRTVLKCISTRNFYPLQQVCAHVIKVQTYRVFQNLNMNKNKQTQKKGENIAKVEAPQFVAEVFSLTRDVEVLHPYHLDGDAQMYSQEKIQAREKLRNDAEIVKELTQITKLYDFIEMEGAGKVVVQKQYKEKQRALAIILRPDIDKEELDFVVDKDWQHDRIENQSKHYLTKEKLIDALWELVDVWTTGASREQYVSFCRLLKKKLERSMKTVK